MENGAEAPAEAASPRRAGLAAGIAARALAFCLGGFALVNVAGGLLHPGFDANGWWVDFRPAPVLAAKLILLLASGVLIAFAIRPRLSLWRYQLTWWPLVVLLWVAMRNAIGFYSLLASGTIQAAMPVPLSLMVAAALAFVLLAVCRRTRYESGARGARAAAAATVAACLVAFPLAQMVCFGMTDYRRSADAVVVFGARAYADGTPSQAMADRVTTACDLYRAGLAGKLILSGGSGDGATSEPAAMQALALRLGVPAEAIVLDLQGDNTEATVRNTCRLFHQAGARRVLAVSHFYHLPRVKLAYQREGVDVFTVPAKEPNGPLTELPWYMAREVAALWAYYVRPLVG